MNHDYTHCGNYRKGKCPKRCFRGQLTEDLEHRPDLFGLDFSFAEFYGTEECELSKKENF